MVFAHYDVPLILGVIAAALAIDDDSFLGRLKSYALTLTCFAIAAFSIQILYPYPVLFALGLAISTFGFVMLGAIGPHYRTLSFGSLLLAIYAMLGAGSYTSPWLQPILLLSGASWFFVISLIWHLIAPMHPVRQNLSDIFITLSNYINCKSQRFQLDKTSANSDLHILESRLNTATVSSLNQCKSILLSHSKDGFKSSKSERYLNIYFLAQDIHERIRSSHIKYEQLTTHFKRSDIMFRFKYVLERQALACKNIGHAIAVGKEYSHDASSEATLNELQQSLQYIQESKQHPIEVVDQLAFLYKNLATVERQLNSVNTPDSHKLEENTLYDTEARSLKVMWKRIKSSMSKQSPLFRHAIRLSAALVTGYSILQIFHIQHGYWIVLTSLFVCQPSYSATKQKLMTRSIGTITGLIVGTPLLALFPSPASQMTIIVISAVLFFAFRINNYGFATAFITVLVLFCFAQVGEGYEVILPRLLNTILGCGIAVIAVTYLLPDWQSKRLNKLMAEAIDANSIYLDNIVAQYRVGKKDNLAYRITRRNAHDKDAALDTAICNMLSEPSKHRISVNDSFKFLTLNHALLGYISALGAHRQRVNDDKVHKVMLDAHQLLRGQLQELSNKLNPKEVTRVAPRPIQEQNVQNTLSEWPDSKDITVKLIIQQLHLINQIVPELLALADNLNTPPAKKLKATIT